MKIAIITLLNRGGMVHYTSQLANSLVDHVEVNVIIGDRVDKSLFSEKVNLYTVVSPPFGSIKNKIFGFKKVTCILKHINPDIIHISGNHFWIFGLYPYLKCKNVVLTLHDVNEHVGEQNLVNKLTNKLHIKLSRHIFVHGKKLRDLLVAKGYPEKNISIIKLGDFSFFAQHKKNIPEDGSVLFFGRIVEYKGIEYLIKAVPLITKHIPNVKIVIAGKGNLDKYTSIIRTPENFELINEFIPDEQVAELFQRASIIVLPYIEASQSGIISIAYSFKKPVITTDVGSISEIVTNGINGILIPPKDTDALANAIIGLLQDDELRKQIGTNAYNKMKNELSWDEIGVTSINVYKKMICD